MILGWNMGNVDRFHEIHTGSQVKGKNKTLMSECVNVCGFCWLQRVAAPSRVQPWKYSRWQWETNRVKLEEKLNYMQKKTDNTLQKACVSCRDLRQDSDDIMQMCVCVCVWWRQEAGGYVTTGGLFPDSFKQNAMACWVQYGRESTRVNAQGSSLRQPDSHTVTWQTEVKGGGDNPGSPPPDSYWLDLYEHTCHLMDGVKGESG